jgi:hypothetical protein
MLVQVGAVSNEISGNVALNNFFNDLSDLNINPPCGNNLWSSNVFNQAFSAASCIH